MIQILGLRRFTAHVAGDGALVLSDGIEYDGKLWLVPEWDDYPDDGVTRPSFMIRFDQVEHSAGVGGAEYLVNGSLPAGLLSGCPAEGYELLRGDEIPFVLRIASHTLN